MNDVARVTVAEANVLSLVRWVLDEASTTDGTRLLLSSSLAPAKLGPTSAALLESTLARGTAHALLTYGGWTEEAGARLWQEALPPLHFTSNLIRVCQWALRQALVEPNIAPVAISGTFTPAEEVFVALLLERARGTAAEATLLSQQVFRDAPLVALVHVASFARVAPLPATPLTSAHLPFVRGLLDLLGDAWFKAELEKRSLSNPRVLARVGTAQLEVAESFLSVVDGQNRRLLARFFIDAAAAWLGNHSSATDLVSLDPESPLRERSEARARAGSLLHVVGRLEQWDQAHRSTHFIDDGYAVAQALVKDWERLGPAGFDAARRVVAELNALPV